MSLGIIWYEANNWPAGNSLGVAWEQLSLCTDEGQVRSAAHITGLVMFTQKIALGASGAPHGMFWYAILCIEGLL